MQTRDVIVDADMVSDDLQTPQTSHSRKRRRSKASTIEEKKNNLIDLAHQALTNTDDDECAVAEKRIGYQLKGMAEQQRFIAEKLISDIMYYGRVGKLKDDASVLCGGFIPSSHLTSNLYHPLNYLTRMGHPSFPKSSVFVEPHQSQMGRHQSYIPQSPHLPAESQESFQPTATNSQTSATINSNNLLKAKDPTCELETYLTFTNK
jgi:hypothetical protein